MHISSFLSRLKAFEGAIIYQPDILGNSDNEIIVKRCCKIYPFKMFVWRSNKVWEIHVKESYVCYVQSGLLWSFLHIPVFNIFYFNSLFTYKMFSGLSRTPILILLVICSAWHYRTSSVAIYTDQAAHVDGKIFYENFEEFMKFI